MPPEPTYPNTWRVILKWQLSNGDVANNILHFAHDGTADFTEANALELFGDIVGSYDTSGLQAIVTSQCELVRGVVQDLSETPYPTYEFDASEPGGAAGDPMPFQMAVVASLHTGAHGRRGRGRVFVVGLTEAANTATGTIETGSRNAVQAFVQDLADGYTIDTHPFALNVLSRVDGTPYGPVGVTVDSRWDSQRRRANRRL